jgi:hypothetical protein
MALFHGSTIAVQTLDIVRAGGDVEGMVKVPIGEAVEDHQIPAANGSRLISEWCPPEKSESTK